MFVHFTIKLRAGKDIFIDVQGKECKTVRSGTKYKSSPILQMWSLYIWKNRKIREGNLLFSFGKQCRTMIEKQHADESYSAAAESCCIGHLAEDNYA